MSDAPLDVVARTLDALGVKRIDAKAFLLGFVLGRDPHLTPAVIERVVRDFYSKPRRRLGQGGGYPAGDKTVEELGPPPAGPAPGARAG